MTIRQEHQEDFPQIRQLVKDAFAHAEHHDGDEHNLIERIRLSSGYIPELSLVAISGDVILGHIMFSKIYVGESAAIALAPLAVRPDWQRQGVGSQLISAGHIIGRKMGYPCSVVLGDNHYYSKFGYESASKYGIIAPFNVPDEYYMVFGLEKTGTIPSGNVRYSDAFGL